MEMDAVTQPSDDNAYFDFENFCLFCNEAATEEFKQAQLKHAVQGRIVVSEIKKSSTQEAILNAAILHKDDWSEQVPISKYYFEFRILDRSGPTLYHKTYNLQITYL